MKDVYRIKWDYFRNYHKFCDAFEMSGACYGLVFNETCPKDYQRPYEFKECVYIGESAGCYIDKQNGTKTKQRSYVHKRMTNHIKPLMEGVGGTTSHQEIIKKYSYGHDVLMGTITGKPLWLGLLIPRPDLPEEFVKQWCLMQEGNELFDYACKWGKSPLGNLNADKRKNEDSWSSQRMRELPTLEEFVVND